jgi:hypothetical protein
VTIGCNPRFDPDAAAPQLDGYFYPPGCGPAACPTPRPPARMAGSCAPDTAATDMWLFNISADPYETCSLVGVLQGEVHALMARLAVYNATQVPVIFPDGDPSNVPSERPGIEKGAWGPWCAGPGIEPGCPEPRDKFV